MSYGGYEYSSGNYGGYGAYGGFDVMGGGDVYGAGGGFMNDPSNNAPGSDKKNSKDKNNIRPISIKQFLSASFENDNFIIDNSELQVAKIVGFVESIEQHSTNLVYKINDGSGTVDCKFWTSKSTSATPNLNIRENTYVKIVGAPRNFDSRRELLIYDVRVVTDFNEVTNHLLDIILTHCQSTKPLVSNMYAPQIGSPVKNQFNNMLHLNNMGNRMAVQGNFGGPDPLMEHVLNTYARDSSETGYSIDEVTRILNQQGIQISRVKVHDITQELTNNAVIYSTIDDFHFKVTDSSI